MESLILVGTILTIGLAAIGFIWLAEKSYTEYQEEAN